MGFLRVQLIRFLILSHQPHRNPFESASLLVGVILFPRNSLSHTNILFVVGSHCIMNLDLPAIGVRVEDRYMITE